MHMKDLAGLLALIDQLIDASRHADRGKKSASIENHTSDVASILEHGVYSPDDPTSTPRRALLAIGETLGAVGGIDLMKHVYDAYETKHGLQRAARLSARWDTAGGVWYD